MLTGWNEKKQTAFTLVEVLLVVMMIGVITVSLYQALTNGLRVWERTRIFSVEEDVMVFFDKLEMDLHNAFNFSLFEFEGLSDRVVFSTIVSVPMGTEKGAQAVFYGEQIGRVQYAFDAGKKEIRRSQAHYGQAVNGEFGVAQRLVRSVQRVVFHYFDEGALGLTERKLDQDGLPTAISVSVEFVDRNGQTQQMTRLINLPLFL